MSFLKAYSHSTSIDAPFKNTLFFFTSQLALKKNNIILFGGCGNVSVLISSHLTNAFAIEDLLSLHLYS